MQYLTEIVYSILTKKNIHLFLLIETNLPIAITEKKIRQVV